MGRSKNIFMETQEEDLFTSDTRPTYENTFSAFAKISDSFVDQMEQYEDGKISALDAAVHMKKEMEQLEWQENQRKAWIDEHKDEIEVEAEKYGNEYAGFKIVKQSRETMDFKSIPEWLRLESARKDFEAKSKAALMMVRKGGLNVDANGEEIQLPEVSVSSFIKFVKLKK